MHVQNRKHLNKDYLGTENWKKNKNNVCSGTSENISKTKIDINALADL